MHEYPNMRHSAEGKNNGSMSQHNDSILFSLPSFLYLERFRLESGNDRVLTKRRLRPGSFEQVTVLIKAIEVCDLS